MNRQVSTVSTASMTVRQVKCTGAYCFYFRGVTARRRCRSLTNVGPIPISFLYYPFHFLLESTKNVNAVIPSRYGRFLVIVSIACPAVQ